MAVDADELAVNAPQKPMKSFGDRMGEDRQRAAPGKDVSFIRRTMSAPQATKHHSQGNSTSKEKEVLSSYYTNEKQVAPGKTLDEEFFRDWSAKKADAVRAKRKEERDFLQRCRTELQEQMAARQAHAVQLEKKLSENSIRARMQPTTNPFEYAAKLELFNATSPLASGPGSPIHKRRARTIRERLAARLPSMDELEPPNEPTDPGITAGSLISDERRKHIVKTVLAVPTLAEIDLAKIRTSASGPTVAKMRQRFPNAIAGALRQRVLSDVGTSASPTRSRMTPDFNQCTCYQPEWNFTPPEPPPMFESDPTRIVQHKRKRYPLSPILSGSQEGSRIAAVDEMEKARWAALQDLDKRDVNEFLRLKKPPEKVTRLTLTFCLIFGYAPRLEVARGSFMTSVDLFLHEIRQFLKSKLMIPAPFVSQMADLLWTTPRTPLTEDIMKRCSGCCVGLLRLAWSIFNCSMAEFPQGLPQAVREHLEARATKKRELELAKKARCACSDAESQKLQHEGEPTRVLAR